MPVFKRRNETPLERELAAARARRDRLNGQLVEAHAALDAALVRRRRELLEDDTDTGSQGKDEVLRRREEIDALSDAIAQLDDRIQHLESRIAQEHDRLARESAAAELDDRVRKVVAAVATLKTSAAAVCEALPGVLQLTPHSNQQFGKDLADLFVNVTTTINETLDRAQAQVAALKSGDGDARAVVVPPPIPPPAPAVPQVERLPILAYGNLKWTENGEVMTIPHWGFGSPPCAVAMRAIAAGWGCKQDDPIVGRLRDGGFSVGQSWHRVRADLCVDLDRDPLPRPPRGTIGQSLGMPADPDGPPAGIPSAVEQVGQAIVGTARVS
jgi:hypothetical protein